MTQFILFLDEAGAEFTHARANRREVLAPGHGKLLRFKPSAIRPLEVMDEKGAGKRAAGGFLLLGPVGAALGVLTGKGPTVLFELDCPDGLRKGVIRQDHYPALRRAVERMQTYRTGDLRRRLGRWAGFAVLLLVLVAATGPAGLLLAPLAWWGGSALLARLRREQTA